MRVMVVAPHPDDEVLGCGGVMARHAEQGDEVHVTVVTRGDANLYSDEAVAGVRAEAKAAHDLLGVQRTHFLNFPAPRLDTVPRHELADALRRTILDVAPEVVYLPHAGDIHHDHGEVYHATLVACRPLPGCPVSRLLCYETLSETEWAPPIAGQGFHPTVFTGISGQLQKKLDAMSCYQSQFREPPHTRSLLSIESLARHRGMTVGVEAAEAFVLVREVVR